MKWTIERLKKLSESTLYVRKIRTLRIFFETEGKYQTAVVPEDKFGMFVEALLNKYGKFRLLDVEKSNERKR